MTSQGTPHGRFARAIRNRNLLNAPGVVYAVYVLILATLGVIKALVILTSAAFAFGGRGGPVGHSYWIEHQSRAA